MFREDIGLVNSVMQIDHAESRYGRNQGGQERLHAGFPSREPRFDSPLRISYTKKQ